ncbi:hypothetical protein V7S43_006373 [Phytophthora oleae]|uniref:RxLR effector protein n=1 Tax=Phytophthora oleae TaxID=2107226 RepID=A0ABD3FPQ9_9STRA
MGARGECLACLTPTCVEHQRHELSTMTARCIRLMMRCYLSVQPGKDASAAQSTGSDSPSVDKIKVIVLGEAAAGKTTLFRRWVGTPLDADYVPSTTASVGV